MSFPPKHKHEPPPARPVVYRQSWIFVTSADGKAHEAGCSYHAQLEDVALFVSDYLATATTSDLAGHEEPLGEPVAIHTTEEYYDRVLATAHGLRSR